MRPSSLNSLGESDPIAGSSTPAWIATFAAREGASDHAPTWITLAG